jgi:hypothetical protein
MRWIGCAMNKLGVDFHTEALTWPTPQMKKGRPQGSPLFIWSGKPSALDKVELSVVGQLRDEPPRS